LNKQASDKRPHCHNTELKETTKILNCGPENQFASYPKDYRKCLSTFVACGYDSAGYFTSKLHLASSCGAYVICL